MKKLISLVIIFVMMAGTVLFAQNKTETIKIKTSGQCGQCKDRMEKAMAYEKGVVKSNFNVDDKILTVEYKVGKTTPDKIRKAINAVGYDADETLADPKAYQNLPACCKKPDDPDHVGH